MKKKILAIVIAMSMFLVACGGAKNKAESAEKSEEKESGKLSVVGFVTDEGGINDESFNQGVYEGIGKAEEDFGIKRVYVESPDANAYKPNLDSMLDEGCELIVGAGYKMGDVIVEEAKLNPDVMYAIVDHDPQGSSENIIGILFRQEEPSFLVGYIAGYTTETGKVGFVGGQDSVMIKEFEFGYRAGVQYAAFEQGKEIEVVSQYVGNFTDVQKGKAIANSMYQQNADIVYHASGGAGDGVIEAAKEQNKWAIGVDRDQSDRAPENILTSAMKNANVAVYDLIKKIVETGEFAGGTTITLGLADEGAVGIAPTSDVNVAKDVLEKEKEVEKKIIDGEIVVPKTEEMYNEFIAGLKK